MTIPVIRHVRRPPLRTWVSRLWFTTGQPVPESVLPAARAQLVLAVGPGLVGALLHGPASRVRVVTPAAAAAYLGVEFRAGAIGPFFPGPADALADRTIALVELWGRPGQLLPERLAAHRSDPEAALDLVEAELARRCAGAHISAIDGARRALHAGTPVAAVAAACGVDRRRLAAALRCEVGFGPKQYARLARFERALRELRAATAPSLATLAARHGYADQAHLTREFGRLAGFPPGRLHRLPGPTPLHVVHDESFKTAGRVQPRLRV